MSNAVLTTIALAEMVHSTENRHHASPYILDCCFMLEIWSTRRPQVKVNMNFGEETE